MALSRGLGAYDDGTALAPGVGTTPLDVRKALSGMFSSTGVLPGAPSPLVTGTSGYAYAIAACQFVTSRGASDGHQLFANDGSTIACPAAPSSGLSRWDVVWVRHPTNTENTDTSSMPIFGVSSSAVPASSSPAVPSIPAGALELARNLMTGAAVTTLTVPGNTIAQTATTARLRTASVLSVSGSLSGTYAGQVVWEQVGRVAAMSDASGRWLLTFPIPFPAGLVSVWTAMDDPTTPKHRWIVDAGFGAGASAAWMKLVDTTTGLPIVSTTSVLSWLAKGF